MTDTRHIRIAGETVVGHCGNCGSDWPDCVCTSADLDWGHDAQHAERPEGYPTDPQDQVKDRSDQQLT